MAKLEELLGQIDDPDLVAQILEAADERAENPSLVKNLRKERDTAVQRVGEFERKEKIGVLKDAGLSEKAYDRFLADWQRDHADDEFTVDNVKAAAEGVYALAAPAADDAADEATATGTLNDPAEQARRDAQDRRRALQNEGVGETGTPPDESQRIAAAEAAIKPGDKNSVRDSLAVKRQMLERISNSA